jgi:ATP-grasp domain
VESTYVREGTDECRGPRQPLGEALIVCSGTTLAWALPSLLWRSGFVVDLITTSPLLGLSRFVRTVNRVESLEAVAYFARERMRSHTYEWVIAADEGTLHALAKLERPQDAKTNYLPAWDEQCRRHLCSKIGLSRVLSECAVKTPAFRVANDCEEAISAAQELQYPVLLKIDFSGGGQGVFECRNDSDVLSLNQIFDTGSILVQKKIEGIELDLSAIYFNGALAHFTYSIIERTTAKFGASVLRAYHSLKDIPAGIFSEMTLMGLVLGASGFVTVSCIEAADGSGRYYIEADLKPNVWVDYSRFYGENAAPRIRDWFLEHASLTQTSAMSRNTHAGPKMIPYFLRLSLFELLVNRYRVWQFIPWEERRLVRRLLIAKAINYLLSFGKGIVPPAAQLWLRARLCAIGLRIDY